MDLNTGKGTIFGTSVLSVGETTWEGILRGKLVDGLSSGTGPLQGNDGSKLLTSWTEVAPGVLLDETCRPVT